MLIRQQNQMLSPIHYKKVQIYFSEIYFIPGSISLFVIHEPNSSKAPTGSLTSLPEKKKLNKKGPVSIPFPYTLLPHFFIAVLESYLSHFHLVGQHFLQSADRQGLHQNKAAYGQVRGLILPRARTPRRKNKEIGEHTGLRTERDGQKKERGGGGAASYLSVGCGFQEAETVPEALAGQTELDLLVLHDGGSALQNNLVILQTSHKTKSLESLAFHF